MRIGELADEAGVTTKTIRFWEMEGLVPPPARTPAGYRDYPPGAADRLRFIRRAQAAGLSLHQIAQVLSITDRGAAPCTHVRTAIDARLAEVEARLADLTATRDRLRQLARRAHRQRPTDCRGYCSIIEDAASETHE